MAIVGLCGTHGTGKSTILNGVKDAGWAVDQTQLSRAAQRALGWDTLERAVENADRMWDLQEAILAGMYDRDLSIKSTGVITLVERTPADVWAYTELWCARHGIDPRTDNHARNYRARCMRMADAYNKFLIVEISDKVPFESDPRRADADSRILVADGIKKFIFDGTYPHHTIMCTRKEYRIGETVCQLLMEKLKGNFNGN